MPKPVPVELVQFISGGTRFIVAGHKEPDGDCVGSQLALCSVLRRMGKAAVPCSAGPFKRTEVMPYEKYFSAAPAAADTNNARVIVVDCSTAERTGDLAPHLEGLPAAVIDHHAAGDHPASTPQAPVFLDAAAPSVTCLILSLIEAIGLTPSKEEAELLLFGLCTDTGFFRHLDSGGADTFLAAAKLAQAGASPKAAFAAINGGKSLDSRRLLGHILSRATALFDGRLIISFESGEDLEQFGLVSRDSDVLYQLLQSVAGVEAIAIVRQESAAACTIGLRSKDRIDVAAIAASFGGGGHRNAAGFSMNGSAAAVIDTIIEAFQTVFAPVAGSDIG
jgi:phosphoesterase RecJ-like protein